MDLRRYPYLKKETKKLFQIISEDGFCNSREVVKAVEERSLDVNDWDR